MEWIIFALLAYFMYAITSTIDAVSIKTYLKNPKTYLFYNMTLQCLIGVLMLLFINVTFYGWFFLMIIFLSGMFRVYGLIPYMKILEFEEVSRMVPLFSLGPIFVLLFSIPILGLSLTTNQYLGFAFLVAGGFLITIKKTKGLFKISKGFWYMMLTNILLTGMFICIHYLFKNYDYWSAFVFMQIGTLLAASTLILLKDYGQKGLKEIRKIPSIAKTLVISVALISLGAGMLRAFSIKLSSAAVVSALDGFQSLFVLLIAIFFSFKLPKILKEETKGATIIQKIIAIILLGVGIILIG